MSLIYQVTEHLVEDENRYRVLIIDSVMSIFRSEFQGRGELAERQQSLCRHLNHLTKVAEEFNLCVFLVNQGMLFGSPLPPLLYSWWLL